MIWEDLIKTALIGTDRTKLSENTLQELATLGIDLKAHPAKVVLEALSFHANMQKLVQATAQWKTGFPAACELETNAICPPLSIQHLSMILNSNYHGEILNEFLRHLHTHQMILPAEQLPELLNRCKNDPSLWPLLQHVVGNRGYWLIQQNIDWQYLNVVMEEEIWETGTTAQRISFLKAYRFQYPKRAVELLKTSWEQDDFRTKLACLKCLAIKLSAADEIFLETCLQDRKKEIRQEAASLLVRIEDARLTQKIFSKIKSIVNIKKDSLKKEKLDIILPEFDDVFFKENGIALGSSKYSGGRKSDLVGQLIALVPPSTWEKFLGQNPKEILEIFARSEWNTLLIEAIIHATVLHQNEAWMTSLLLYALQEKNKASWQDISFDQILKVLPDNIFNKIATQAFKQQTLLPDESDILTKLLQNKVRPWEDNLSLLFIQSLKGWISRSDNAWGGWHYKQVLAVAQYSINPGLFKSLTKDWPEQARNWHNWIEPVERFLAILSFRGKMALAFNPKNIDHEK